MRHSYSVSDVSVCVPYWIPSGDCDDLRRTAESVPVECDLVLCDDGSPVKYPWRATRQANAYVMLPRKDVALNPCVPLNAAVAHSTRSIVVLTNPGIEIPAGGLERMLAELDEDTYVAAACRDGDGRWLCHSTWRSSETLPPGAGFHFLAMFTRSLFDRAGGFDERYRNGQAYEDADFLWRLQSAGAAFKILDDLVVSHRRSTTQWPSGGLERNRELYRSIRAGLV